MEYLPLIAKTALCINNLECYLPAFLLGFFFIDRKVFTQALLLLFFTMIYNLYLKSLWQIPLQPPLDGWAFPSGHMHSGWVFWGWLALNYKRIICIPLFLVMMSCNAAAMIYFHYHNLTDIFAAAGFGSLSLMIYYFLNQKVPVLKDNFFLVAVLLGGIGISLIQLLPEAMQSKAHIWQAQGGIMGIAIGWLVLSRSKIKEHFQKNELILFPFILLMAFVVFYVLSQPFPSFTPQNHHFFKMFMLLLWVMISLPLLSFLQILAQQKIRIRS